MKPELGQRIVDGLRDAGIGFVSYLPESRAKSDLASDARRFLVHGCSCGQ